MIRAVFAAILALSAAGALAAPAPPTVIANVNVVTLDERGVLADAAIETRDGKIARILPAGTAPSEGAAVIDGGGGFLIPGLVDAHIHFQDERELLSYLRYGVTTVFSLGDPEALLPDLTKTLSRQKQGLVEGAHIYATGLTIANHRQIKTVEEVKPFFDYLQAHDLSLVKVYNRIDQPVFDAVVKEAHARQMGVFGHIPRGFPAEYALANGLDVVAHMEEFFFAKFQERVTDSALPELPPDWTPDYGVIDPLLTLAAENEVAIVPNLVASDNFRNLWVDENRQIGTPEARYIDPETMAQWWTHHSARRPMQEKRQLREEIKYPFIRTMTYRAQQKGVLLLAGTDAPLPALFPGRSLHEELRLLVSAGLTSEQALRAATANAGQVTRRLIDHSACIGTIQIGCEADLVLLSHNPLEDIRATSSIVGVMSDGRWRTAGELDARREAAFPKK